jgi:ubiquinone/menaquinone biosynthesis C-methylase UbiE
MMSNGSAAQSWDTRHVALSIESYWRTDLHEQFHRDALVDLVRCYLPASMPTVLEVGCGTGLIYERLAAATPPVRYVGVDSSMKMLAIARRSHPHGPFLAADGYRLPFRDGGVDITLCFEVLGHLPDPESFLAELIRVTRGTAFFTVWPSEGADVLEGHELVDGVTFPHRAYSDAYIRRLLAAHRPEAPRLIELHVLGPECWVYAVHADVQVPAPVVRVLPFRGYQRRVAGRLRAAAEQIEHGERRLSETRQRLEGAEQAAAGFKEEVERVMLAERIQAATAQGELAATARYLDETRAELADTRALLGAAREDAAATRERLERAGTDLAELQSRLAPAEKAQGELALALRQLDETRGELADTRGLLGAAREEVATTRERLQRAVLDLREARGAHLAEAVQARAELAATVGRLEESEGRLDQAGADLAELRSSLDQAREGVRAWEARAGAAETRLGETNERLGQAEGRLARWQHRARAVSVELTAMRRRRLLVLSDRFRPGPDLSPHIDPSFQDLLDDSHLFLGNLRGYRLHPSEDLQAVRVLSYALALERPKLAGLALAPIVDLADEGGSLGIELATPDGLAVAGARVPLGGIAPHHPVRFEFPALSPSVRSVVLRVDVRDTTTPVRLFEWRKRRFSGLGPLVTRPFCALIFA